MKIKQIFYGTIALDRESVLYFGIYFFSGALSAFLKNAAEGQHNTEGS